uniref:Alkylglycerone-phosphate synthase n=1 Tax=Globodera pallida TaxID=36090 RepID=A0A183C7J5_GLOPA
MQSLQQQTQNAAAESAEEEEEFNVPDNVFRDSQLKWNGWGYKHSAFVLSPDGQIVMHSDEYVDLDGKPLPALRPWIEQHLGVDLSHRTPSVSAQSLHIPPAVACAEQFLRLLRSRGIPFSNVGMRRVVRSHGQTLAEVLSLRMGQIGRIVDLVVWPRSEAEVEEIVRAADAHGVALIPIGGGTSVSNALNCPQHVDRCVCSVDMALMDHVLSIDTDNHCCTSEAGILGQVLERKLNERGFTCGHEPDSMEFSTLGGWISTRASGMKKNKYGNIEDLLLQVTLCTPKGTFQRMGQVPRLSAGPDLNQLVLGSEGTLGVIVRATIKIFPVPDIRRFDSILFPNFEAGVCFMRQVASLKCQPASLRLVDNQQFQMGQAMRVQSASLWRTLEHRLARIYVTRWKGFRIDQMVAVTCVFEGTVEEVERQQKRLVNVAEQFGGMGAGEENGRYGYRLTFAIAYLRDMAMDHAVIGESFETSVPWSRVSDVCRNVRTLLVHEARRHGIKYPVMATCRSDMAMDHAVIGESFETSVPWSRVSDVCRNVRTLLVHEARRHGIKYPVMATCRVTQVYDAGACVYFYFAFNCRGMESDPMHVYEQIEKSAEETNGG